MDNATRSDRTRRAALEAALAIIARDGPGRLTLDAIARESGISKGGLMHQFKTKEAVLKALLDHQVAYFENYSRSYRAEHGAGQAQPELAAQIATLQESLERPHPLGLALLGAVAQEPGLLADVQESSRALLTTIRAEAADPDLAVLRWLAARGLVLTTLMGLSPLEEEERERLFARLRDDARWAALEQGPAPRPGCPQK
ncbi:TetR/AcrR family transcriptional regulator [Roseomonas sp. GC11]|uniref:TetR/AcrR family transcriptional regulator n=1 Tax=Roseomonas sp. GC11 TaxID=2950546 RepID=UPI002108682D|nr:TetR/AcrR family transcriptional regulator [Roseomonas sp. GC11]MCQ4158816.1 TetR/AcrR family transcriptional regulator [Roseomonas sp. GC11]